MEQVKRKGKMVTIYTEEEVIAAFEKPRKAENPPEAHPGFKDGIRMWDESMSFLPEGLTEWVAVNQNKTHFRCGEHHIGLQDALVSYWVEKPKKAAKKAKKKAA